MYSSYQDKHSMPIQKNILDPQSEIRLCSLRGRRFADRLGDSRFFHNGLPVLAD